MIPRQLAVSFALARAADGVKAAMAIAAATTTPATLPLMSEIPTSPLVVRDGPPWWAVPAPFPPDGQKRERFPVCPSPLR